MIKSCNITFLLILAVSVGLFSCATVPKSDLKEQPKEETAIEEKGPDKTKEKAKKKTFTPTKDEKKSLEIFSEILDLIESTNDRQSVLPQIEAAYKRIISEYPEAPLAQESYWKLIEIYLKSYSPPEYEKAEAIYSEFRGKYPKSVLKGIVDDTMGNEFYKKKEWNRLLKICTPVVNEYLDKKNTPRAALMYKCAEAHYNLGNFEEAEKGYKILADLFPKTSLGKRSISMIDRIKMNQD